MGNSPYPESCDVVVLGTGMAGLCSAIASSEAGADTIMVEIAPESAKGGNTRYAGGLIRCPVPKYTEDDFLNDIMVTSQGRADYDLTQTLVQGAADGIKWLEKQDVKWETSIGYGRTRDRGYYALGGGQVLSDTLNKTAQSKMVKVYYDSEPMDFILDAHGRVLGLKVLGAEGTRTIATKSIVIATGGFEANVEMRVRYLGKNADEIVVRGTRYNMGWGHQLALRIGAQTSGQWGDFHSAVIAAQSSSMEAGETNINTFPYTIIVNMNGKRFLDEGEDTYDLTYVKTGKKILEQPQGRAACVFDSKLRKIMATGRQNRFNPIEGQTLRELATRLSIDPNAFEATIVEYNSAVTPGEFDPLRLDGKHTMGITPQKSNWAAPIDTPPFYAFPVTGGITFTFGGLRINNKAQVIDIASKPIGGLFAAGNATGGFFYYNYPSGSALTRALVYGRIAGEGAAGLARRTDGT